MEPVDIKGCAQKALGILKDPGHAQKIGKAGKEFVRKNFLITRLLTDYLDLIYGLLKEEV